jgi:fructose-1,6-bisphosphatase/inositol monophosphatase family enzyme
LVVPDRTRSTGGLSFLVGVLPFGTIVAFVAGGGTSVAVGVVLTLATNTFFAFGRTRVAYGGGHGMLSISTFAAEIGVASCG